MEYIIVEYGKQVTVIKMHMFDTCIVEERLHPIDSNAVKIEGKPYENLEGIMVVENTIEQ